MACAKTPRRGTAGHIYHPETSQVSALCTAESLGLEEL